MITQIIFSLLGTRTSSIYVSFSLVSAAAAVAV